VGGQPGAGGGAADNFGHNARGLAVAQEHEFGGDRRRPSFRYGGRCAA
jgi:hypothetical protein